MDEESMMNASSEGNVLAGPSSLGGPSIERPEGMSKNAMKRAAKQAKMEAMKPLKRAAEKARRKERAAELSKGYKEGTLSEKDKEIYEKRKKLEKDRKAEKKKFRDKDHEGDYDSGECWNGGVVIDLGFDELMNEQEINSMSSQIGFCYSSNRIAPKPIKSIVHTGFSPETSPRLWTKMIDRNWDRWSRSYWWKEDVGVMHSVLSSDEESKRQDKVGMQIDNSPDQENENEDKNDQDKRIQLQNHLTGPTLPPGLTQTKHTLIYLSADAEEELETLDESHIYIIGGIVDRNRYRNLCQNKAEKLEIRTARLPIGKFIDNLPTRKVLTVNQVFDILLQYIAQGDWQKAFETVIPQRKFHESRKAKFEHHKNDRENEVREEDDERERNEDRIAMVEHITEGKDEEEDAMNQ
ncbi:uncharacterized protein L199_003276 [Kwoniella botswanensis]|uniref:uncharacterized protein n=1 Tax=Kwoniella botswanensis TaxID=1268659 RepID=UPI00315C980B